MKSKAALVVAVLLIVTAESWGQDPKPIRIPAVLKPPILNGPTGKTDEDLSENVFLAADRHTLQKLADSRTLLAERRFSEAVRCLGDILEEPEDYFFQPDRNSPIHRSLKNEAQRLIGRMPREGRELYELQYGARAKRMLDEALEGGVPAALAEVSRQFFHTRAGYQATFLLGLDHFDHGRPLAGALTLQRLQEAGASVEELEPGLSLTLAACWLQADMPEKAQACLVSLRQRHPKLRVTVAGREVPLFTDNATAIDWLVGLMGTPQATRPAEGEHWWMLRGNAARNASMIGGMPLLNLRWRVPSSTDPRTEDALDQFRRQYLEEQSLVIPALHPLVVGDVLLMRTAQNLLAVDFTTGKRLWETPMEEEIETAAGAKNTELQMRQAMLYGGLAERAMSDMTYGAISSDGRRAFAIEDLELSYGTVGTMVFRLGRVAGRNPGLIGGQGSEQEPMHNRLAAYDIHTGKLVWNLGGPAGQRALRQPETFFLGAPLPLMDQLYVLSEIKGEIRLMALDAATGDKVWSQQLAVVEQGLAQDPTRRAAGVTPSYADGILVCPTSTGAIVGVDLATRSLLWGYRYGQGKNHNPMNPMAISARAQGQRVPSHWVDGSVSIADGRVLATPVESESLYCLDLSDGRELWQAPRQEDLYVACADREKVVLVGCHTVRALRMADGKPLWEGLALKLPDDAMPSGRGFHADNRYYLPLSTAEVVAIDLDSGKIVNRAKSHNHLVPGNLVCYRDKLISQGIDGVETYYQLDAIRSEVKRRLAADPKDAEALSLQGETFLEDGKRSEAVASFRRSYELQSDPKTRELLLDALLDGLRLEFAAYQKSGDEVERLLDDSAKRVLYYRLMTDGFRQEGQWASALKYCEKVVDLEPNERVLDRIDENLSARRDRWVQGRLALLHNQIVGQVGNLSHGILDAAVQSRLKAAMDDRSIGPLQKFLDYFGDLPSTETARSELVRRLHKAGRLLEAELAASDSTASKSQPTSEEESWPVGKVEASVSPIKNVSLNGVTRNLIEIRGDRGPYFSESSLYFDSNRHILYANDGWGRQQWQVSLESDGPAQIFALNRAWSYAQAQNHLLLVALSWKIMAFDTSASGGNTTPRLLWTQNLMTSGDAPPETQAAIAWPMPNIQWQQRLGRGSSRLNLLGPVTNRYLCFQKLRTLDAVDPWSGKTLWSRSDIPAGSTIFGDHEHLFVLPPDRDDALLLRAIDGELLGTRKTPRPGNRQNMVNRQSKIVYSQPEEYCLTTFGRRMLLWWPEDSQQRLLTMVDPLEGRDLWPGRSFANNAHTSVAGDRAVGVMQLDGHFVMTSLPDGRTLADVMLEPEPRLIDITLMANGGKYYLLTRSATNQEDSPIHIQQIPGCDPTTPIEQGHLYAFDAQGKLLWPRPAVINRQFMLLNQPARLPVLSFASQLYEQNNDGSVQQFLSLMVIDKRNGRVAYKKAMTNSMGLIEVSGDAGKKTVDLTTQRETIRLTFTDQPLPPPAKDEYQPAQLPQESGKLNGFWKSLEKMMENALDELGKGGR